MRILICGDRNWTDTDFVHLILEGAYEQSRQAGEPFTLIEGCAPGADRAACHWRSKRFDIQHLHFPADWKRYGYSAGPIRNRQMVQEGKPDVVYAFHDDLAGSRGTIDMLKVAKKEKIPVILCSHG